MRQASLRRMIGAAAVAAMIGGGAAIAWATEGPSTGTGCSAIGLGGAEGVYGFCQYVAPNDKQNVIVGTDQAWSIFVIRCCTDNSAVSGDCTTPNTNQCYPILIQGGALAGPQDTNCVQPNTELVPGSMPDNAVCPVTFTLLSGSSLPVPPRELSVSPMTGETVSVSLDNSAYGFVSAGQDQGIENRLP